MSVIGYQSMKFKTRYKVRGQNRNFVLSEHHFCNTEVYSPNVVQLQGIDIHKLFPSTSDSGEG